MSHDQDPEHDPSRSGVVALATEIRRLRKLAGLSQSELAARVGYSRQYVSRAERPKAGPASADLVRTIDTAVNADGALIALRERAVAERLARRNRPAPSNDQPAETGSVTPVVKQLEPFPADAGIRWRPWSRDGILAIMDDWVSSGLAVRRAFLSLTGAAFAATLSGFDPDKAERMASALSGKRAGDPLAEQIEQSIPQLQRLDDAAGGGAHLAYVGAQFRAVAVVLHQGGHAATIEARLLSSLAELGQLAGWMALDAGQHAVAQRYLLTALRAAYHVGSQAMAAHILADLAFQAATREYGADAVVLGEIAQRAATRAPTGVRASVLSRSAYGHAVTGDLNTFEHTYRRSREIVENRSDNEPRWMYYLTGNHLDTQAGYALVHAGDRALTAGEHTQATPLLQRGRDLLRTGAHSTPPDDRTQQRRALFEGAWLAVAEADLGDLEQACTDGRRAVARTARVNSDRSLRVLRTLNSRLRHHRDHPRVAEFLPALDTAIAAAP